MSLVLFSTKKLLNRTVTDPDFQIRGEPGHPDPEIRGGGLKKKSFRPFGPQFGLKIRGPSPGSATAVRIVETDHSYFEKGCRKKVHNPERYCGWFWVHCSLKKFERMTRETMDICLWVLKESRNSKFDSYSVRNSVLIISHITFRDCRVHIFSGNLSRNSRML